MKNEPDDPALKRVALIDSLPPGTRKRLLEHAVIHSVGAGTVLFEQGSVPTFQHVVLKGSAHLFGRSNEGREVLIEVVRPGDLVIPAAVVTNSPYLMQARILEPSRFLLIEAHAFRAAVEAEPALAQAIIASLAGQFRRMVRQIKNLKLRSSTQRVGSYILALSREQKNAERVTLPFEKNVIASELGMTRESFSRTLSALRNDGIRVQGDTVRIIDAKRLARVSGIDTLTDAD